MTAQVLAVKARLVQDSLRVQELGIASGVRPLTLAMIYCACGCRITRARKVLQEARMALRGHRQHTPSHAARYEQALLANALVLAKRTTPARKRTHQRQP